MDYIPLYSTTTTTSTTSVNFKTAQFCLLSSLHPKRSRNVSLEKKPRKVSVLAAKDESPKLDPLDQMELKFGNMLGEDHKSTLAKIMAQKSTPDMSYLEIEKSFEKKKGKSSNNKIEEVPFDVEEGKRSDDVNSITDGSLNDTNSYAEIAAKGNVDQALESRVISSLEENVTGLQPSDSWSSGKSSDSSSPSATKSAESDSGISLEAALLDKPKRLDDSVMTTSKLSKEEVMPVNPESNGNSLDLENFLKSPIKEREENDWKKAEDLVNSGGREEVEIVSSSTRGFTVSFGSLIGFLPYRNLAAKWKFLAFESWLRRRGLDPSKYKQHLGVIRSFETAGVTPSSESRWDSDIDDKFYTEISPDTKLEDLVRIYNQQKSKFLSSFVGQKIKVTVVLADRRSRRLIFSTKPKEKEELIEKKRNLMARLSVGDIVKCCIKKITYFGIFVEVEEVPALIHQTEVSWVSTLDPASDFKIGQIVEAKVHQLDFSLEHIFLSLKEITPDPLIEALEAVVGGHDSLDGRLEATQADSEWAEVESLIKGLQQVEGIQSVSKGRYFLSPGLAPTFQVYMASMFENQYKLLARSGKKAQEVIVETSLGKEEMKSIILTCTNRVQ